MRVSGYEGFRVSGFQGFRAPVHARASSSLPLLPPPFPLPPPSPLPPSSGVFQGFRVSGFQVSRAFKASGF